MGKTLVERTNRVSAQSNELRNTGMLRLRRLSGLCGSNVSDPANRFRKTRKKKSSAVLLFRSGRRSPVCVRLSNKGKVGVQRGRETAGVPSFLPPPRARQSPALRRAQLPRSGLAKNLPPGQGVLLTQFVCPGQPVQKKEPPGQGEPPVRFRYPEGRCREKTDV